MVKEDVCAGRRYYFLAQQAVCSLLHFQFSYLSYAISEVTGHHSLAEYSQNSRNKTDIIHIDSVYIFLVSRTLFAKHLGGRYFL